MPHDLVDIEEQEAIAGRAEATMARHGIPLVWLTPSGEKTVYATRKPLGVQFRAEFPLKVKREPEGHGKDIGIQLGWILKSVNGIDVTGMTNIAKVNEILYKETGEKTVPEEEFVEHHHTQQMQKAVELVWETPIGEKIVYATKKPLGVKFLANFPLKVKREPEGHGKELGIQLGWILKRINGMDVTAMNNINKVNEILYREVGEKTVPTEQWRQTAIEHSPEDAMEPQPKTVSLTWDTPAGEQTVYATKKPLGIQFKAEFPLQVKQEPQGHGKELGIKVGWILKCINGADVTVMSDINKVDQILHREIGEKTVPVDQWRH
jgi:hypothetical protein